MYIQTNDLIKTYKERNVVNRVSIHVDQGQIVGLLGPNGAGKTTTFYMIVGIEHPSDGSIYIDDHDITGLPIHKRAAYGIGYLPQEASIFRKLTVEDNLLAMLETTTLSRKEQKEKAEALMEEFTITKLRNRLGIQLSGGERRRVEIARCLVMDPAFILLDEPFAGIDPLAVNDIQDIISHLKDRGIGVLITDHNVRETLSIVDKAYILNEGQILLEGSPQMIANDPVAKKFYLGEEFTM
ncbi:LPS export ABC transporter ATP-binding protein [Megasphaera hexanoica]|jgi:lipopolysaccharide export system ATP-binding protein|uniref:LPS export ABC transporter ATP-binding protein n=1 Tax=Megasphaera hexanoica TaxID=1675036 RepID=A0A848BQ36_9FIRM|nr:MULTISPECIES: LPS export ABC transporter ATP-binding protein [Megasphaera]MCI5532576.1 LPS export ABC transporter ATP-binding protein [Caecibacter massiliensis]HAM05009.1 LPS export ABC transporter ATP-binding protein [Megasphaera sp.]AXB81644.1 LPS export ABC transporter ATP-binding protein [Megasphaera hexanoica]KUH56198.1 LPS export ABC transporter ATP-binding protein [Megasphaera sp. DJF_B143]MDY2903619.1 LPS export ABC transporter ATP-binding protein [Caecibacter massiliensis]